MSEAKISGRCYWLGKDDRLWYIDGDKFEVVGVIGMSEVRRYLVESTHDGPVVQFGDDDDLEVNHSFWAASEPAPTEYSNDGSGVYVVLARDYDALRAELDRLRKALTQMIGEPKSVPRPFAEK